MAVTCPPAARRASLTAPWTALLLALAAFAGGCPVDGDTPLDAALSDSAHCPLVVAVQWTTDEPASSHVEFGVDADPDRRVGDDTLVTDHEVIVVGLRAETSYQLHAVSVTAAGDELRSEPLSWTAGSLELDGLRTELRVHDEARTQPGWTLTNIAVGRVNYPPTAVLLDEQGVPVWYHALGTSEGHSDIDVRWIDGGAVLIGGSLGEGDHPTRVDLMGRVQWAGPEQPGGDQLLNPGDQHHSIQPLANGDHVLLKYDGKDNELYDTIDQLDEDGAVVWTWSTEGNLPADVTIYPWGNSAQIDLDEAVAYYNGRQTDRLFRVDMASGEVEWAFGRGGDFAPDPAHAEPWPLLAHAPDWLPDGHLLMYDNGGAGRRWSRAVEFALDTGSMTSEIVWEYPPAGGTDEWYTAAMGDADRLANGNTLITAGTLFDDNSPSRIFEVTAAGEVVWELGLAGDGTGELAGGYASERIPAWTAPIE